MGGATRRSGGDRFDPNLDVVICPCLFDNGVAVDDPTGDEHFAGPGHRVAVVHDDSRLAVREVNEAGCHAPFIGGAVAAAVPRSRQSRPVPRIDGLGQPFARAPRLLAQEHGAELAQSVGAVDEHLQDVVAFGDREGEQFRFAVVAVLEPLSGVVEVGVAEAARDREDQAVGHGDAGEHHRPSVHLFVSPRRRRHGRVLPLALGAARGGASTSVLAGVSGR